jgi:hypothetical protein
MIRGLIAVIVALAITITGFVKPAYAYSSDLVVLSVNPPHATTLNSEDGSTASIGYAIQDATEHLVTIVSKGFAETVAYAIGAGAACYILDGVATMFFPPAAAAAAFCPVVGGTGAVFGGTKAASEAL